MDDEFEQVFRRIVKMLRVGAKAKSEYVDPDDMVVAYQIAITKNLMSYADNIIAMMHEHFPDSALTALFTAKHTALKGDPVKAFEIYDTIDLNEIDPYYWEEYPYISHCAIVAGNNEKGLEYYRRYLNHIEENPSDLDIHMTALAADFFTFGCDRKSLIKMTEMTVEKIRTPHILLIAANNMSLTNKLETAMKYLKEASEKDPMNPEIWKMMTRAGLKLMDYDVMKEACSYYMALCPDTKDFEMLVILADSFIDEGNFALAMGAARKCSRLKGLSKEERIILTLVTARCMKGLGESSKKIEEYLKRRCRIIGSDERITKMLTDLQEEE